MLQQRVTITMVYIAVPLCLLLLSSALLASQTQSSASDSRKATCVPCLVWFHCAHKINMIRLYACFMTSWFTEGIMTGCCERFWTCFSEADNKCEEIQFCALGMISSTTCCPSSYQYAHINDTDICCGWFGGSLSPGCPQY